MHQDIELHCRCGEVRGRVAHASPRTSNRVVCYCDDCQAFLHHLGRADLLDAHGGTDIIQVALGSVVFDKGADRLAGVRLSPKGLYRWYASCCKTPLGNTVGPVFPFVGIVAQAFDAPGAVFGEPRGGIMARFALGTPAGATAGVSVGQLFRALRLAIAWKLRGPVWPNPFFDRATRAPSRPVTTLSAAEREALRPLSGPTRGT